MNDNIKLELISYLIMRFGNTSIRIRDFVHISCNKSERKRKDFLKNKSKQYGGILRQKWRRPSPKNAKQREAVI